MSEGRLRYQPGLDGLRAIALDRDARVPRRPSPRRLPRPVDVLHALRLPDHRAADLRVRLGRARLAEAILRTAFAAAVAGRVDRPRDRGDGDGRAARRADVTELPLRRDRLARRSRELALPGDRTRGTRTCSRRPLRSSTTGRWRSRSSSISFSRRSSSGSSRSHAGESRSWPECSRSSAALSFVDGWIVVKHSIDRAYYGTDTRALEFLIGALLAVR